MGLMVEVRGIIYKYFGGRHTKRLAQEQAQSLRRRGHLAIVRKTPSMTFPWTIYWRDRSSKR